MIPKNSPPFREKGVCIPALDVLSYTYITIFCAVYLT